MDDILNAVSRLIRDMFDEFQGTIDRSLTASDVPQWDSLGHIQLMVLIEQKFKIKFNTAELRSYATLGELVDAIALKTATRRAG